MSLAPLSSACPTASGSAVFRIALSCAVVGWLWLAGPLAFAQSTSEPVDPTAAEAPADAAESGPEGLDGTAALSRRADDEGSARRHATSEFYRELRSVEEEVSQLKERVFRSKATLKLLKELVVDTAASGSRVILWHVNDLGGSYVIESVQYLLDGKNVYTHISSAGSPDEPDEVLFHEQILPPGEHNLQANLVLRGKGHKIFSYLESFQFKVQSAFPFTIEEGKVSIIRVVLDSKGGFKNFEDRPTVRYDERKHMYRETGSDTARKRPGAAGRKGSTKPDKARSKDDDAAP